MDTVERPPMLVACLAIVPLTLVVILIVVLVVLGADPMLALGSFVAVAAAAARMVRG